MPAIIIDATIGLNELVYVDAWNPNEAVDNGNAYADNNACMTVSAEIAINQIAPILPPPGGLMDPSTGEFIIPPQTGLGAGVTPPPAVALLQVSQFMPALKDLPPMQPTGEPWDAWGRPDPALYKPTKTNIGAVGRMHVAVSGRDVTYLAGAPVSIQTMSVEEPFGPTVAVLRFPQLSILQTATSRGLEVGNDIDISLVSTTGNRTVLWEGYIVGITEQVGDGESYVEIECQGALFQADHILAQPELVPSMNKDGSGEDIGSKIARFLNKVPGRRYKITKKVTTGIKTLSRGEWQPLLSGYVGDLLAESTFINSADQNDQWTIVLDAGRQPRIVKKSTLDNKKWTVTAGTPGISIKLSRDLTEEPTHIFGSGINAKNAGYGNLRAPEAGKVNKPSFPGTIKAGQKSATIQAMKERLLDCGLPVDVTKMNTFTSPDANLIKYIVQRDAGLAQTGEVNKATWTRIWAVGTDAGRVSATWYDPFAYEAYSEQWLYNADGTRWKRNPKYRGGTNNQYAASIRVDRYRRFPDGTSKASAFRAATAELARDSAPGAINNRVGTITLKACPEEGHRWAIRPGHTIHLKNFMGDSLTGVADMLLRVISVDYMDDAQTVELQVDTRMPGRDALTLDAIKTRNREAATISRRRSKRASAPTTPMIDSELIGRVAPHTITPGQWNVRKVRVGYDPTITSMKWTSSTKEKFCVAFFTQDPGAANLNRLVPKPLAGEAGDNPWASSESVANSLAKLGFIDAVGGPGQAAGYWPGQESHKDEDGKTIDPLTGVHYDEVTMTVQSEYPPYIWVAEWAAKATTMTGLIYVAPVAW